MMNVFKKQFVVGVCVTTCILLLVWWCWTYIPVINQQTDDDNQSAGFGQVRSWHLKQKTETEMLDGRESVNFEVQKTDRRSKTSLTRLGSSLNFDATTCPEDSLLSTSKLRNSEPLHDDCPTLFIVGARKGGTTSLYNYMSHHPDFHGIFLNKRPGIGETFYFANKYKKMDWKEYVELFPPRDVAMSGDASVANLVQCEVPKRIFTACGKQAKIVMLFRDPVDRFVSNILFRHKLKSSLSYWIKKMVKQFSEKNTFLTATDEFNVVKKWSPLVCLFAGNLVFEGLYYIHLLNWLCNFPSENILIINSEEFFSKPSVILDQVVQFVGLRRLTWDEYDKITGAVYNKGNYTQDSDDHKLFDEDKKKLLEVYEPYNRALLRLLDWPMTEVNWKH